MRLLCNTLKLIFTNNASKKLPENGSFSRASTSQMVGSWLSLYNFPLRSPLPWRGLKNQFKIDGLFVIDDQKWERIATQNWCMKCTCTDVNCKGVWYRHVHAFLFFLLTPPFSHPCKCHKCLMQTEFSLNQKPNFWKCNIRASTNLKKERLSKSQYKLH